MDEFSDTRGRIVRVLLRVLPTCDWVAQQHYIPAIKNTFNAADIALAGEPEIFYINDVPTFRRLFSRQMTDREMEQTLKAESVPTIARTETPDQ